MAVNPSDEDIEKEWIYIRKCEGHHHLIYVKLL